MYVYFLCLDVLIFMFNSDRHVSAYLTVQVKDPKAHRFLGQLYELEGEIDKAVGCYKVRMLQNLLFFYSCVLACLFILIVFCNFRDWVVLSNVRQSWYWMCGYLKDEKAFHNFSFNTKICSENGIDVEQ